jgi:hypothetical protein
VEFDYKQHVGLDAATHFLDTLQKDIDQNIMPKIEKDVEMIWNDETEAIFEAATHCSICTKPLNRDEEVLARDHCHFTGYFINLTKINTKKTFHIYI